MKFSDVVLGFWRLPNWSADKTSNVLQSAIELGINTIDEADIYGDYKSQEFLGRVFKADSSIRNKVQIVSKVGIHLKNKQGVIHKIGFYDSSKEHIVASAEQTLIDLGTDRIDLLLIHRPDLLMNPQEINEAFLKLKNEGKVLNFGVSNFTVSQFEMLQSKLDFRLVTNQIEFSVMETQAVYDGTLDFCLKNNTKPMAWSPLAGGELFSGTTEKALRTRNILTEIGSELGNVPIDQVALAWILKHPSKIAAIIGTMNVERIESAVNAQQIKLSREQWYRILVASQGFDMP